MQQISNKLHIIIVAAGRGSRFGSDLPKQFCTLGDMPVLIHTAVRLGRILPHASMCIVLSSDYVEYWEKLCQSYGFTSPKVVVGGATRWESVKHAVDSLDANSDDIVLIHDGVRPIVNAPLVDRVVKATVTYGAAIPVVSVTDSLRQLGEDGHSSVAVDRSRLVGVQTPQGFLAGPLKQAYSLPYTPEFTDDASVWEAAGLGSPALVEGSHLNIKITNPHDLDIAALFMER